MPKTRVLFIGSFPKVIKGGISTANRLLLDSEEFKQLDIIKIDSTLRSLKQNYWVERVFRATMRFLKLNWILLTKRPQVALIFSGHGFGFLEKGSYLLYLRLFGIRTVFAPRSGILLKNLKTKFFKSFSKMVFKRASWVICQGKYWKRIFSNYCEPDKLVVIHNWIPLPSSKVDCEALTNENRIKLLYLGWLEQYKGISSILLAVKELHEEGADFELTLHGEGSMRKDIQNYIEEHKLTDKVFLRGWVSDEAKEKVFLDSNALILASKFEGMPNVLLEAMSYGLPVIANGITSVPEVVHHKANGLLYFRQNVADLKVHIMNLITNRSLCKRLSVNARKRIEDKHQVGFAASKIIELLRTA